MLYNLQREYKHIIKDVKILKFRPLLNSYELLAEIIFIDDSILYVKDYLFLSGTRKYSYHWQSKNGDLLNRWDNAPHWPDIPTFPHHKHIKDVLQVEASKERNLKDVLKYIDEYFGYKSG